MSEENSNNTNNISREKIYKLQEVARKNNIDLQQLGRDYDHVIRKNIDPTIVTGFGGEQDVQKKVETDQNFFDDVASSFVNGLIMDTGEGLANLIPTVAQAAGADNEFLSNWKKNVGSFFESNRLGYSDAANQDISEFSDINASHIATGIGQGLGFIASIFAGGSGGAALGTKLLSAGVKASSAAAKASIAAGKLSNITLKGLKAIDTVNNSAKIGGRIGSFMTGTTVMYPMVEKEAKEAGLNNVDAARFALAVSSIVSLTEGAALEAVGLVASKPFTTGLANKTAKEVLKKAKGKNLTNEQLQKLFIKSYTQKSGSALKGAIKGTSVEAGQEFGQTYIEEGAKVFFDKYLKDKEKGFGTELDYKTFVNATFAGAIGGLIGGGMGAISGVRTDVKDDLSEETLFGYINNSVQTNNTKNFEKLNLAIDSMLQKGNITKEEAQNINNNIENLTQFSKDLKSTDIKDGVAQYQLYQLDKVKKNANQYIEQNTPSENANPTTIAFFEEKNNKIQLVTDKIQEHFDSIFNNKKPDTKNKIKFENKLESYNTLIGEIERNNISEEKIAKELDKIFSPKESKIAKEKETKDKTFGNIYTKEYKGEELQFNEKALDNLNNIKNELKKVEVLKTQNKEEEAKELLNKLKEDYGLSDESLSYIKTEPLAKKEDFVLKEEVAEQEVVQEVEKAEKPKQKVSEKVDTFEKKPILTEEEITDLAKKEIDDINKSLEAKEIDQQEAALLKRIQKARRDKNETLEANLMQQFYGYQDKKKAKLEADKFEKQTPDEQIRRLDKVIDSSRKELSKLEQKEKTTGLTEKEKGQKEAAESIIEEFEKEKEKIQTQEDKAKPQVTKKQDVVKAKPKYNITSVSENETTVNDIDYNIDTDEKGNVVGLRPKNKPEQVIKNEALLRAVEIERNKNDFNDLPTGQELDSQLEIAIEENPQLLILNGELDKNLSKTVEDALNNLYAGKPLTEQQKIAVDLWVNDALENVGDLYLRNPNTEIYENAVNNLEIIKDLLYEQNEEFKRDTEETTTDVVTEEEVEAEVETKVEQEQVEDTETKTDNAEKLDELVSEIKEEGYNNRMTDTYDFKYSHPLIKGKFSKKADLVEALKETIDTKIEDTENLTAEEQTEFETIPENLEELTPDKLEALASKENISDKDVERIIKEQERRNEEALENIENLSSQNTVKKDQRVYANTTTGQKISDNQELYNKIKNHFRKIFPNISVAETDRLFNKYGGITLARVSELGIEINPKVALQTSLIHEYGHIYMDILGDSHPIIKAGLKFIEGTQFDLDAQKLYPDYTRKEQLKEALTEAIAQDSLEKLRVKFEGSNLAKFQEFAKRFWRKIKSYFSKSKSGDIVGIISDGLILKNSPYSVDNSFLTNMSMDQRSNANPRLSKTVDLVNTSLIKFQLNLKKNKIKFSTEQKNASLQRIALKSLMRRYYQEKSNIVPDAEVKIFEDIDLDYEDAYNLTEEDIANKKFTANDIKNFTDVLNQKDKNIISYADRVSQSLNKISLYEEYDESLVIEDNQDPATQDNSIKANKNINKSIKSIMSSIVDENGYKIDDNKIWQYLSLISSKVENYNDLNELLDSENQKGKIIPKRLLAIMNALDDNNKSESIKRSIENQIVSLYQEKYEATNIEPSVQEDEFYNPITGETYEGRTTEFTINDNIVNKDKDSRKQYIQDLEKLRNNQELLDKWNKIFQSSNRYQIDNKNLLERISKIFDEVFEIKINAKEYIEKYPNGKKGFSSDFFETKFESSITSFLNNEKLNENDISGRLNNLVSSINNGDVLLNTFLNTNGNQQTSTQNGHFISRRNKFLLKKNNIEKLQRNTNYKDNALLKFFKDQNQIVVSKLDAVKNIGNNNIVEYKNLNTSDFVLTLLQKYATNKSTKFYNQSIGVKSNRDSVTFVRSPRFTSEQLKNEYEKQAKMLDKIYQELKQKNKNNPEMLTKIDKDFKEMYLHKIVDGKIVSGYKSNEHKQQLDFLNNLVIRKGLQQPFMKNREGSLEQIVEDFFYTEALNRSYLKDIYSGVPLYYANSKKDGAKQSIKRLSGTDSTGLVDIIEDEVYVVVIDDKEMGSDSFNINGRYLTKALKDSRGPIDGVKINSKDQVYQVSKDGQTLYLKKSSLNLEGDENNNNLQTFSDGYANIANIIMSLENAIERKTGKQPLIKFMDSSAIKGSYSVDKTFSIEELGRQLSENKGVDNIISSIPKMNMTNHRTLNQANKSLDLPYMQNALMGTQGALIQLWNKDSKTITDYQKQVLKMIGVEMKGVSRNLLNVDKLLSALSQDLNERDKTSTSILLDDIIKYNKENPNNKITALDHPSIRGIAEQFIASKLSKKGIKVNLPGNFLHQLPDVENRNEIRNSLAKDEIAVSWKMFFNENPFNENNEIKEEFKEKVDNFLKSDNNKVVVERIPTSAEMSIYGAKVARFINTDANVVILSQNFVDKSDSDHDGDKAMVYRKEIDADGNFRNYTDKTKLFDKFYKNVTTEKFIDNQQSGSLDFEKILPEKINRALGKPTQQSGVTKEDMKIASVVDMAKTSTKMKFGSSATGRFAIASKLMSVFTQNNISLNDSIKVKIDNKEIELKKFKNNSSDDMAILLQAALDMGNDPILSSTGINGFTIDVANTFLLLGLDLEQTMKIINDSTIQSYAQEFENINSIYNTKENISFKKFIRNLRINDDASFNTKKPVFYKPEELINLYGQNMAQFIKASDVANDLSSLIDYIQLDKQLPNNSIKAFNLNDTIKKFDNYSFNVNNIQQNDLLYNDRQEKLKLLRDILHKNFLTSNKTLQNKINNAFGFGGLLQANNPNQFKNQFNEDLIHLISQNQLSKRRPNVFDFMYNTSKKLENIKNSLKDLAELPKEVTTQVVKLYEIKEQFGSISNEFAEQKKKVERIIKNVDSKIKIYEEFLENKKDAEKYKGNKFIENLNFFTIEKTGEKLVSLSNNFKGSEKIKNNIIKGFKDLQNLNPELAQDIIDYQLYRYGVNNKIGSFIDILPSNINMQVSKDLTRYKKDDKFIRNNMDNIINNIALKNIEMIKETDSLFRVQQDMSKNNTFQTQKEFTQFSTQEINKIPIEKINDIKNNC